MTDEQSPAVAPAESQPAKVQAETKTPSVDDLLARVGALEKEKADIEAKAKGYLSESIERRQKLKAEAEEKAKALEANLEYKALAETLKKELTDRDSALSEFASVKAEVAEAKALRASLLASADAKAASLSDDDRELVKLTTDPVARLRLVDRLLTLSQKPTAPAPKAGDSGAAPSGSGRYDFGALSTSGDEKALRIAINADPDGWKKFLNVSAGASQPTTIFGRARAALNKV